jgi:hypothetical protein
MQSIYPMTDERARDGLGFSVGGFSVWTGLSFPNKLLILEKKYASAVF